jgi:TetR/AcrR family transcriptional regulator, lmrAB and yxaGH operons repressor
VISKEEPVKTRERMLSATMRLVRQQGVAATGVLQVLDEAGAPRGSLYHHFPGGKSQLVAEALQLNAEQVTQGLHDVIDKTPDVTTALITYADALASDLESSRFQSGCPLATAVLEQAATDDAVAEIGDQAFEAWRQLFADELGRSGVDKTDNLALLCVAAFEGALVLSRAKRNAAPLRSIARVLASLVEQSA